MGDELLGNADYRRGYEDGERIWREVTDQLRAEVEQQHQQILRYMECQTAILRALAAGMAPREEPCPRGLGAS
jgi:hypothetical protein